MPQQGEAAPANDKSRWTNPVARQSGRRDQQGGSGAASSVRCDPSCMPCSRDRSTCHGQGVETQGGGARCERVVQTIVTGA